MLRGRRSDDLPVGADGSRWNVGEVHLADPGRALMFRQTATMGRPPHPRRSQRQAEHDVVDLTIIGGGPTGLFAMFYAGMRGATARIVDALPQVGGQLTALYPEKYIFDVAGFPKVLAKDLVRALSEQASQFGQHTFLNQRVDALEEDGGVFTLVTETDRFPSRAILVAAGIGAFSPDGCRKRCADRGTAAGSTRS